MSIPRVDTVFPISGQGRYKHGKPGRDEKLVVAVVVRGGRERERERTNQDWRAGTGGG